MEIFLTDIVRLFQPESSFAELIIRGTILYLGILVLMRILPRRTGGELEMMDLIFVVLIAEAATHSLAVYTSITEGFVMMLTIIGCNYLVNILSYHVPFIEKLVSAPPLLIIRNGKLLRRNMRREYITEEELMDHLRKKGIDRVEDIKSAYIEGDGQISILSK